MTHDHRRVDLQLELASMMAYSGDDLAVVPQQPQRDGKALRQRANEGDQKEQGLGVVIMRILTVLNCTCQRRPRRRRCERTESQQSCG